MLPTEQYTCTQIMDFREYICSNWYGSFLIIGYFMGTQLNQIICD